MSSHHRYVHDCDEKRFTLPFYLKFRHVFSRLAYSQMESDIESEDTKSIIFVLHSFVDFAGP